MLDMFLVQVLVLVSSGTLAASQLDTNEIGQVIPTMNQIISSELALGALPTSVHSMELNTKERNWYFNPDGSCVQLSIGMCGVHCNDMNAATLPFNSVYGPQIRGGSWPGRVANYCNQRKIKAWNITGQPTIKWIEWAAETNRGAAIGLGTAHFQTLYGWDKENDIFLVCNNQTPGRIDKFTRKEFISEHEKSGRWCVILQKPSSRNPQLVQWYK